MNPGKIATRLRSPPTLAASCVVRRATRPRSPGARPRLRAPPGRWPPPGACCGCCDPDRTARRPRRGLAAPVMSVRRTRSNCRGSTRSWTPIGWLGSPLGDARCLAPAGRRTCDPSPAAAAAARIVASAPRASGPGYQAARRPHRSGRLRRNWASPRSAASPCAWCRSAPRVPARSRRRRTRAEPRIVDHSTCDAVDRGLRDLPAAGARRMPQPERRGGHRRARRSGLVSPAAGPSRRRARSRLGYAPGTCARSATRERGSRFGRRHRRPPRPMSRRTLLRPSGQRGYAPTKPYSTQVLFLHRTASGRYRYDGAKRRNFTDDQVSPVQVVRFNGVRFRLDG